MVSSSSIAVNGCRGVFNVVSMVVAIVIGFLYSSCDKEMSTWLLVYGFMTPIIFILLLINLCLLLPGLVLGPLYLVPSVIFIILFGLGSIFLVFGWGIYGATLFFPVASGPYPVCENGNDGQVLVITGMVIVILQFVFCCCCCATGTPEMDEIVKPVGAEAKENVRVWYAEKV